MKNPSSILVLLLFLHCCFPIFRLAFGQLLPIVSDDQVGNTTSRHQIYIVHVEEPPRGNSELLSTEDLESWHLSFLPNTTLDSGKPRLVYSYRHVLSGFAARLTHDELKAMESLNGFVFAHPDEEVVAQTTYTPQFLGLNQGDRLSADTTQGEGMIIGVIDTGIHATHPSFQDDGTLPRPPRKWRGRCGFNNASLCTNKLIGATAFIGGAQVSPLDDNGHGTHTASTAAGMPVFDAEVLGMARGTAYGTAPRAHVAAYKVLNRRGRGQNSDMLRGVDQAINDGVDVLSMSLGLRATPLHSTGLAVGSFAAIRNDIFPSAAAANEGPTPSAISNDFPWGLTVGASSTDRRIGVMVRLGNGMEMEGQSAYQPQGFNSTQLQLVYPGANNQRDTLGCRSMGGLNVTGKIVLCHPGVIPNVEMGEAVKQAGGAAMIIMNSQELAFTTFADPHVIPAAYVSHADGMRILAYMRTSPNATAAIRFRGTRFGARPSPAVASFSGRGPSLHNGGILKPDILGPGVNILAAWPFEVGPNPIGNATSTFNFQSGTSMATPHLSGIAALLKKNHPNWSPAAIKSAIMTTAYKVDRDGNPITDEAHNYAPASVFAMGAGHVNPAAANDPGLVYDLTPDDYIPYLCGMYGNRFTTVITRTRLPCQTAGVIAPEQLNYPSIAVTLSQATPTKNITRTVTNVGDANEVYAVAIAQPQGVAVQVTPSRLQFTQVGETANFIVGMNLTAAAGIPGQTSEGSISWVSNNHVVTSTVVVSY